MMSSLTYMTRPGLIDTRTINLYLCLITYIPIGLGHRPLTSVDAPLKIFEK